MITIKTLFIFGLSVFISFQGRAQEFNPVPDDNILVQVPSLGEFGKHRLSWGVIKSPNLWIQGKSISLTDFKWPGWDKAQVPLALLPGYGTLTYLTLYAADGSVIEEFELKKAFVPDLYKNNADKVPTHFQVKLQSPERRVILLSPKMEWMARKPIFSCDIKFDREDDPRKSSRLSSCLTTLKNLPNTAKEQWYLKIKAPKFADREINRFFAENLRDLRKDYIKSGNIFEAEGVGGKNFEAVVGRTFSEKAVTIAPANLKLFADKEFFEAPPSRDEIKKKVYESSLPEGHVLQIYSYASDEIEARSYSSPETFDPGVNIQFVASKDENFHVEKTEFKEARTGIHGFLRSWQGSLFAGYNQITSNRGEQDSFLNLPGVEAAVQTDILRLMPFFSFESGMVHSGSSLSISELLVGARRDIGLHPALFGSLAYHRYSLSGRNPGSTRLGKTDALAAGIYGQRLLGEHLLRGRVNLLISDETGLESQVEYGRVFTKASDLQIFVGAYVGYAHYAAEIENRVHTMEVFTEDRFKVGVSLGFVGPDSLMGGN